MAQAPGNFGQVWFVGDGGYSVVFWEYSGYEPDNFFIHNGNGGYNGSVIYPGFLEPFIGPGERSAGYGSFFGGVFTAGVNQLYVSGTYTGYDQKNSAIVSRNGNADSVNNLAFLSNTTSSLTFRWDPPSYTNGPVTGYRAYYRVSGSGAGWSDGGSPSGAPHTINGLALGTTYDIMVKAVTTGGESTVPDQFQARITASTVSVTTPGAPGAPSAVRGAASGTVDLTWSAPGSNGGAPIDLYLVQYSTDGSSWSNAFTTAALSGSATGLSNGTSYTFRVLAHNSQGYGPASGASNAVIPGTAPDAPAAPTATVDDRKSTVSWVAPAANGYAITSYLVQYTTNGGSTQVSAGSVNAPSTSLLVTPLAQGVSHQFRVAAVNAVGQSAWSDWSAVVIPTGLPGAPTVVATQIDADATNAVVKIEITPPAVTGGFPIDNYRLETSYDNGVTWDVPEYPFVPDQTTPWYQVSEPFPVKTIIYRAAAITSNGTGDYSVPSAPITTTLPPPPGSAPDAPTLLSVVPGNNQIVVTWDPPLNPGIGANVNSLTYTVQYSTDGGITWTTAP